MFTRYFTNAIFATDTPSVFSGQPDLGQIGIFSSGFGKICTIWHLEWG